MQIKYNEYNGIKRVANKMDIKWGQTLLFSEQKKNNKNEDIKSFRSL